MASRKDKEGTAAYMREWRAQNRDKCREYQRRWVESNPERAAEVDRKSKRKHNVKHCARVKLYHAVAAGKVLRMPCEECGNPEVQAHHEDYSKPLEVRWLCHECHMDTHHPNRRANERTAA